MDGDLANDIHSEPSHMAGASGDSLDDQGDQGDQESGEHSGSGQQGHGTSGETSETPLPNSESSEQLGPVGDLRDQGLIRLEDLRLAADFIAVLRLASLDDPISGLS